MSEIYDKQNILIDNLNNLKGYEGYVQFSNRKIEKQDVFKDRDIDIVTPKEQDAFLYEAHFFSKTEAKSISVHYINGRWYYDETEIPKEEEDIQCYQSNHGIVKIAQIWEAKEDENCNNFEVKKLVKVVFAGFKKEANHDTCTL